MTAFSPTGTSLATGLDPGEAVAAATAAAADLPSSRPLVAGTPGTDPGNVDLAGKAVCARFTGAAQGEVAVLVGQDVVAALQDSPMGELDLAEALRPALQSAAGTFGPAVLQAPTVAETAVAVQGLMARGEAVFVPLADGGTVHATLALVITGRPAAPRAAAAVAAPAGSVASSAAGSVAPAARPAGANRRSGLDLLHDVEMEVTAELGRTRMTVRELLSLAPGAIVELDRAAGSASDLLVNGRLIACGEVVVVDENFGLRITEIVAPGDGG